MRSLAVLAICTALCVPAVVLAQATAAPAAGVQATPQPSTAANPEKPKTIRQICKSVQNTGSRLGGTHECHTQAEWDQMSRDAQEQIAHRGSVAGPH